MKFENTNLENHVVNVNLLTEIMEELGFVLAGQWDYQRVTYDYKFEQRNEIYYLRVQGFAVEGHVESNKGKIQLLTPLLGKYYYPHGVEYGEGESFPQGIIDKSNDLLKKAEEQIALVSKFIIL
ncbi:YugN family protein [Gottfriedia luciferensis]|uniref:YugN family protein n=1 Tax=Gottfriedia luciferensis TaxID=178774 RepID=UPI000B43B5B8|nr:YugN family protein [Gottfriedia luciferensis]